MTDKIIELTSLKNLIYDYLFEEYSSHRVRFCDFPTSVYIAIEQTKSNRVLEQVRKHKVEADYVLDILSIKLDLLKYRGRNKRKLIEFLEYIKKMLKQISYYEG